MCEHHLVHRNRVVISWVAGFAVAFVLPGTSVLAMVLAGAAGIAFGMGLYWFLGRGHDPASDASQ